MTSVSKLPSTLINQALLVFLFLSPMATLLANNSVVKRVPNYVKEIIESDHIVSFYTDILLNFKDYRVRYAQELGFPDMDEYLAEKTAEGMQKDEASDLYELMFINSDLSENEIKNALTNSPDLRADIFATTVIATSIFTALVQATEELGHNLDIDTDDPMFLLRALASADKVSEGLAVMFVAIDDPSLQIDDAIKNTSFLAKLDAPLYYSDELTDHFESLQLEDTLSYAYTVFVLHQDMDLGIAGNMGEFLLRLNHVSHQHLDQNERNYFKRIGITNEQVLRMFPAGFSALLSVEHEARHATANKKPAISIIGDDPHRVGELDFAIIIDLLYEAGSLSPAVYSPAIATDVEEYRYVKDLLDKELEYLGLGMDELVALLHHSERPASLLQVLQLLHKAFNPKDIADLEYATRDAIIVADVMGKEEFLSDIKSILQLEEEPSIAYLNKLIKDKGQLTFVLLDKGYELNEIQPHYIDYRFKSSN